jgi:hypothetical protein
MKGWKPYQASAVEADDYWAFAGECRVGDNKVGADGVVSNLFIVRLDQVEASEFFVSFDGAHF